MKEIVKSYQESESRKGEEMKGKIIDLQDSKLYPPQGKWSETKMKMKIDPVSDLYM